MNSNVCTFMIMASYETTTNRYTGYVSHWFNVDMEYLTAKQKIRFLLAHDNVKLSPNINRYTGGQRVGWERLGAAPNLPEVGDGDWEIDPNLQSYAFVGQPQPNSVFFREDLSSAKNEKRRKNSRNNVIVVHLIKRRRSKPIVSKTRIRQVTFSLSTTKESVATKQE